MKTSESNDSRIIDFQAKRRSRLSFSQKLQLTVSEQIEQFVWGDLLSNEDLCPFRVIPTNFRNISDEIDFQIHEVDLSFPNDRVAFLEDRR